MKQSIYFDSGTTNSRAFHIRDGEIQGMLTAAIGTVDNVTSGNTEALVLGLKELYERLLKQQGLKDQEIDLIGMSGMASSRHGVKEIPFVSLPVDIDRYTEQISTHFIPCFGRMVTFYPGLSYCPDEGGSIDNIECFHNVRGEELELFGILFKYPELFKGNRTAVIMPGSHTHILYVEDGKIVRMISCMGGEFYKAMAEHTILKSSVSQKPDRICVKGVQKGYQMVKEYGINRALYMVRTLELFSSETKQMRESYLEGVIHADLVTVMQRYHGLTDLDRVVVAGKALYGILFPALFEAAGAEVEVDCISQDETLPFALSGFLVVTGGK